MGDLKVTWGNIFILAGLVSTILAGLVAGTTSMMEWRISAVQSQLKDRMTMYQREIELIDRRLDKLEAGR